MQAFERIKRALMPGAVQIESSRFDPLDLSTETKTPYAIYLDQTDHKSHSRHQVDTACGIGSAADRGQSSSSVFRR
ncbi:hypothetical protein D3C85_1437530 [compost metagenome]